MDDALLGQVTESPRLPSLPAVALEVIDLVQRPDIGVEDLAKAIGNDPALSAKVLRTVNSSFYAQARTISTIEQAIVILGLNSVRTLALGFALVDTMRRSEGAGFDYAGFWERSLLSAVTARTLAGQVMPARREEAFLSGLLHQLGVLALNEVLGERYQAILAASGDSPTELLRAEDEQLQLTHTGVGEALATSWNLPPTLTLCLRHYPAPDEAPEETRVLAQIVGAADAAARLLTSSAPGALSEFRDGCGQWFSLDEESAEALLQEQREDVEAMRSLFEISGGGGPSVAEILMRANEALAGIGLESQEETSRLESENRQLAQEAGTDLLTGIANRRRFDEFIADQVSISRRYGSPLSLLFIDLDHFKQVNDTFGHQVGDEVLRAVGDLLAGVVRGSDLAARYGGEEFAIVQPSTQLRGAVETAARLRLSLERLSVDVGLTKGLRVTASIGVSTFDGSRHRDGSALIAEADARVYEAKQAGRNRVVAPSAPRCRVCDGLQQELDRVRSIHMRSRTGDIHPAEQSVASRLEKLEAALAGHRCEAARGSLSSPGQIREAG
jgi:diguanylate cyclase (GGDEF)-like protein